MPIERRVDVHHHFYPPQYLKAMKTVPSREGGGAAFPGVAQWTTARTIEEMDKHGVTTAVLSLSPPGPRMLDVEGNRKLARLCGEYAAQMSRDNPGRFGLFAPMPMPDVDGTLKEIAYALDVLKADGIGLMTSYGDKWVGDPAFDPVFEELNRRKALVYTHPVRPQCCSGLLPEITESAIEYGTDTTRTIASLVFSGAATRWRDIRWIFSHAGGTMPFLIGRFIGLARSPEFAARLPQGVLPVLRSFYYDTAQVAHPGAMSSLMQLVQISQVLFGTDFPFRSAADHVSGLGECGFTQDELSAIEHLNATRLLPRCAR
jgi:6-methylsalicylate decarboxylase